MSVSELMTILFLKCQMSGSARYVVSTQYITTITVIRDIAYNMYYVGWISYTTPTYMSVIVTIVVYVRVTVYINVTVYVRVTVYAKFTVYARVAVYVRVYSLC